MKFSLWPGQGPTHWQAIFAVRLVCLSWLPIYRPRIQRVQTLDSFLHLQCTSRPLFETSHSLCNGPTIRGALATHVFAESESSTRRQVVANLMEQCERERVTSNQWVERESAIKSNYSRFGAKNCLSIDCSTLGLDFEFKIRESLCKIQNYLLEQPGPFIRVSMIALF